MQDEVIRGNSETVDDRIFTRIGEGLGIPAKEIRDVLGPDRYADAVRVNHDVAVKIGTRGVPIIVFADRLGILGAASQSQYRDASTKRSSKPMDAKPEMEAPLDLITSADEAYCDSEKGKCIGPAAADKNSQA
jgi:predicted DsbA family dithiol-disulfide isomerase